MNCARKKKRHRAALATGDSARPGRRPPRPDMHEHVSPNKRAHACLTAAAKPAANVALTYLAKQFSRAPAPIVSLWSRDCWSVVVVVVLLLGWFRVAFRLLSVALAVAAAAAVE